MTTIATSTRRARGALLFLASCFGLLLLAAPAQAQDVCGDLEDMTNETLDLYLEELNDEFDVDLNDGDLCTKLTENFIKACQTAVKDAVKCIQNQFKNLNKQNQTACKVLALDVNACTTLHKNEAKAGSDEVAAAGNEESDDCETIAADEYFDVCMFGF